MKFRLNARPRALMLAAAFAALMWVAPAARADWMQTWEVVPGSLNAEDNPVTGTAEFDYNSTADTLTITLTNLIVDPSAVNQNISDLLFVFTTGQTTGTLMSSSGQEVSVASGGAATLGSMKPTGWVLRDNINSGLKLDGLGSGTGAPEHTIIGAPNALGVYGNANNSIAGNGPHNPFLNQSATFVLSIDGLSNASRLSAVTFSFGTESGDNAPGQLVPEPASLSLIGIGLAGFAAARFRRRRPA